MSKMISIKKGAINTLTVVISYTVAVLSLWLSKKTGLPLSDESQLTLTIFLTSSLSGTITGLLNWNKHKPKKLGNKPKTIEEQLPEVKLNLPEKS